MHVFRRGGSKWTDTVYTVLSVLEGVFQVSPFVSRRMLNQWFQFVRVACSEAEYDIVVLNRNVRLHVGPLCVSAGRCKCYCLTSRISDDVEFNYPTATSKTRLCDRLVRSALQLETAALRAAVESRARP